MKVLHCVAGNLYGGVEALLATQARHRDLVPGLQPEFAVCFEGRLMDQLRDSGAPVHHLGAVRFSRPWTILAARRRLRSILNARRPDVLVSHGAWPYALFAPVAKRMGRPVVFWMHDIAGGTHWLDRLSGHIRPDLILANSQHTSESVFRLFPGRTAEVLYCPVEPPEPIDRPLARAQVRSDLNTAPDSIALVIACRLERWKGHTLLLDALGRLRDRPDWTLWIAGGVQRPHEQVYLDELKAQAQRLGLSDRVRWLGQRSDIRRLLASADLHCQPNIGPEPFGITFIEALYAALPVVSTRLGGASEIVDDSCGVLVEPDRPDALADALTALFDDPARRARLGASGPARAAQLSDPTRVLSRLSALLEDLAGTPAPAALPPLQPVEETR